MGYWRTDEDGHSFATDSDMVWGDSPADIMDAAIKNIIKVFIRDVGRKPTPEEIVAGARFSAGVIVTHYEGL